MRFIARLTCLTGTVAFHRHGEDCSRPLCLFTGSCVSRVYLVRVMPASVEIHDVVIREVFYQIKGFRVLPKKVLSGIRATVELTVLQFTIADFIHPL